MFNKYASVTQSGQLFMTDKDLVVTFLKLLPEDNYNEETLTLLAGVIDQNKDDKISFEEFVTIERRLCHPDALYRMAFQLFDKNGDGSVSFREFEEIMSKVIHHQKYPFDLESSFIQLYFGKNRDRRLKYKEFCQFLHHYNEKYSKYAFKAFDQNFSGNIDAVKFCDLMLNVKSNLLTEHVRKSLLSFITETEGHTVTFAYAAAFRALLSNMEEIKKIYLQSSRNSRTKEISKDQFLFEAQQVSQATPLEVEILFKLSYWINRSETIIYSDLEKIAPEVYMKNVTRRIVDIKLVERPEDRTGLIEFLESAYRVFIGSLSGFAGAAVVYPIDIGKGSKSIKQSSMMYVECLMDNFLHYFDFDPVTQ